MREILFRGKVKDNGQWVYGSYCPYNWNICGERKENPQIIIISDDKMIDGLWCEVIPETVGQYTGLTDKNGKKIFEGDIVRYQFDNDDCPFPNKRTEPILGRVFFSDFRASFSVTAGRNGGSALNNDLFKYVQNGNRVEVIGNINDDPELLKEGDGE